MQGCRTNNLRKLYSNINIDSMDTSAVNQVRRQSPSDNGRGWLLITVGAINHKFCRHSDARAPLTFLAWEHHHSSTSTELHCLLAKAGVRERTEHCSEWDSNPPPLHHESDVLPPGYGATLVVNGKYDWPVDKVSDDARELKSQQKKESCAGDTVGCWLNHRTFHVLEKNSAGQNVLTNIALQHHLTGRKVDDNNFS